MSTSADELPEPLLTAVLRKLGLTAPVPLTLEGLQSVYCAWCRGTGYDSVTIAMRAGAGDTGPIPGFPPRDYFESWLAYGVSNVCFANSEALYTLLRHFGFAVQRARGSTGSNLASSDHGTLIVSLAGEKYLVDPTLLAEHPLHLVPGQRNSAGSGPLRIWTDLDGTIRWQIPQAKFNAVLRLGEIGCDSEAFRAEHEKIKEVLVYGRLYRDKLFVRRNADGGTLTYNNGTIVTKRGRECVIRKIDREALRESLVSDFRISPEAVARIPASYLRTN